MPAQAIMITRPVRFDWWAGAAQQPPCGWGEAWGWGQAFISMPLGFDGRRHVAFGR